jgi:hypothetical protein
MQIDWQLVVEVIKSLAWPAVVAFALYLFRRPLVDLVAQLARRAKKLTVYEVSVELATLPELSPSWAVGSADVRQLTSAQIFDSASQTLLLELVKPGRADYAVVNLGTGKEWLTSRLFVFALILGTVARLRAFVFLETAGGVRRRFLGIATPASIHDALARSYPWLEEAHVRAAAGFYSTAQDDKPGVSRFSNQPPIFTAADPNRVANFLQGFLSGIQRTTTPPAQETDSHLQIGTGTQLWERAHWIDGERLEDDLTGCLQYGWCEDTPDKPRSTLAEAILRRNDDFVALVDPDRRFVGLVDRKLLLDQTWKDRKNEANESTPN